MALAWTGADVLVAYTCNRWNYVQTMERFLHSNKLDYSSTDQVGISTLIQQRLLVKQFGDRNVESYSLKQAVL